ncbi:MAG: hypothetical protein AAF928_09170 [Myxococcota bacterium]
MKRSAVWSALGLAAMVGTTVACGGNEPAEAPDGYPVGPYGTEVGDTLAYAEFAGFVSPEAGDPGPYVPFDMVDIQASGSPQVLIHLAATF